MKQFLFGFLAASVLWGVGIFVFHPDAFKQTEEVAAAPVVEAPVEQVTKNSKTKRGKRRGMRRRGHVGDDDLGENGPRELNAGSAGGEAQLTNTQIESVFDANFSKIRRCLVLVEEDVSGKIVFGLRIDPTGRVSRANLRGPSAVTKGEAGSCMRMASKKMKFPAFDGPPMVAHYPITLE